MNKNPVIVVFRLKTGNHLDIPMSEEVARETINGWVDGKFNGAIIKGVFGPYVWAMRADEIQLIHTKSADPRADQETVTQSPVPWNLRQGNTSGY